VALPDVSPLFDAPPLLGVPPEVEPPLLNVLPDLPPVCASVVEPPPPDEHPSKAAIEATMAREIIIFT
jgi:hypothetical protein